MMLELGFFVSSLLENNPQGECTNDSPFKVTLKKIIEEKKTIQLQFYEDAYNLPL